MISTHFKNLFVSVACLFAGVSAQAQFKGSAEQYPTTGYEGSPIEFALSEVANALDTDAATLGAAIDEYVKAETPATPLFSANGAEWTAETEAANHGFWMEANGTPVAYGDNSVWYCSPMVDDAFTTLTFSVGQMPGVMNVGDKGQTTITLKYNEKSVTLELELNVIAKPEYQVPEPTLIEGQLDIVGTTEVVIEQYPRGGYDSDVVKVKLGDALSKLGINTPGLLVDDIAKVVYTTAYNDADVAEGGGLKKDSLTNAPTAGGHGFWYRAVQNEEGEYYGEVSAANWGEVDKFFMENFSYSAETDTLSCSLGQYPGSCKENETWFANIYLVYGSKAFLIKYTLKVLEKEQGSGLAAYTKVGEETVIVEEEPRDDYSTDAVHPDLDAIAAALGCEPSAIGMVALDDKDNFAASTANNGGFWFSDAGTVVAWANGSFFVEPATANDYSTLNVGQHVNRNYQVGDEANAYLYFTNGMNYYAYTVTLRIVEPEFVDYGFQSVDTRSFALQAIPSATDYPLGDLITISVEDIEAAIGTSDAVLYGLNNEETAAISGNYSKKYSCDPNPGFWLAKDGTVSKWSSNSPVGICYKDGVFTFFQYPGVNAIGDVFKTQLFLVNEENKKMMTVNITLSFVETIEQKYVVGSESIIIPFGDDELETEVDLSKAAEALRVEVEDLLNLNNYYLRGMAAGAYGEGVNCENGLSFATNGEYEPFGGSLYVFFTEDDGKVIMTSGCIDPVTDDFHAKAQFCFEYDNNQYVFYATLASEEYLKNLGKPGDVNGDGTVDVADISAIISVMAGTATFDKADVNNDGSVDVADISNVITIMAN